MNKLKSYRILTLVIFCLVLPIQVFAMTPTLFNIQNAPYSLYGILSIIIFIISYAFVISEEWTGLAKSSAVMLAAGLIWLMVANYAKQQHTLNILQQAIQHSITSYFELFLFLIVTIIYVNALEQHHFFSWFRDRLLKRQLSYKRMFWLTGCIAFILSAFINNLTAAMLVCAVILSVGEDCPTFVTLSAINIVVAANAGGVFDPFGDVTTLMVWQNQLLSFSVFFNLFIPAFISFIIPAVCLAYFVPAGKPKPKARHQSLPAKARHVMQLFILSIIITVIFQQVFHLSSALGMITGLGLYFCYELIQKDPHPKEYALKQRRYLFAEQWDTLLFFYGVMLAIGGLATFGYLALLSHSIYPLHLQHPDRLSFASIANILVGFISAIVDNIPVMYAIIKMRPPMSSGQWLLVTLTSGIGGSILAVGSAAGIALLGQAKTHYTFNKHLRFAPIIIIGYIAAIVAHMLINVRLF